MKQTSDSFCLITSHIIKGLILVCIPGILLFSLLQMDILFSSFTGYCGCDVWWFRPGSVVADFILIFADSSSVGQSAIQDQITNSIDLSNGVYNLNDLILSNFDLTTVTGKLLFLVILQETR